MKNSSIKQEVQNIYGLTSMKLIKVAVNRWLSYGKVAQRILDCYKVLVKALDAIYIRNRKPAVHGVRDDLANPTTITTICFLADVLHFTKILQCILQGSSFSFLHVNYEVFKLIQKLRNKCNNMSKTGSYFHKLDLFLDIPKKSAKAQYIGRSYIQFDVEAFIEKTTQPFLHDLIKETENLYKIPNHLTGFAAFDSVSLPKNATELAKYEIKETDDLFFF